MKGALEREMVGPAAFVLDVYQGTDQATPTATIPASQISAMNATHGKDRAGDASGAGNMNVTVVDPTTYGVDVGPGVRFRITAAGLAVLYGVANVPAWIYPRPSSATADAYAVLASRAAARGTGRISDSGPVTVDAQARRIIPLTVPGLMGLLSNAPQALSVSTGTTGSRTPGDSALAYTMFGSAWLFSAVARFADMAYTGDAPNYSGWYNFMAGLMVRAEPDAIMQGIAGTANFWQAANIRNNTPLWLAKHDETTTDLLSVQERAGVLWYGETIETRQGHMDYQNRQDRSNGSVPVTVYLEARHIVAPVAVAQSLADLVNVVNVQVGDDGARHTVTSKDEDSRTANGDQVANLDTLVAYYSDGYTAIYGSSYLSPRADPQWTIDSLTVDLFALWRRNQSDDRDVVRCMLAVESGDLIYTRSLPMVLPSMADAGAIRGYAWVLGYTEDLGPDHWTMTLNVCRYSLQADDYPGDQNSWRALDPLDTWANQPAGATWDQDTYA